jgi:hypothetical protein
VREISKGTEPAPTGEGDEPSDLSMAY